MNRYQIKDGLLLVVPAVVVPLVVVFAAQGGLTRPQPSLPVGTVASGSVRPAEAAPEPARVPSAPGVTLASRATRAESGNAVATELPPEPVPQVPTATLGGAAPAPVETPPTEATRGETPAQPTVTVTRPAPAEAATAPAQDPTRRGRQLTRLLYTGRLDRLWATFGPDVRAEWGDLEGFRAYRASGRRTYGAETRVLREEVRRAAGLTYYLRTATFERGPKGPWTTIFGLDDRGGVRQFGIVEASLLPDAEPNAAQ